MKLGHAFYNLIKAAMCMGDSWSEMMSPLFEELGLDQTEYQDILPEEKVFEFAFNSFDTNFCRDYDTISCYIDFISDSIQDIINDGLICHNLEELIDSITYIHHHCNCELKTMDGMETYLKTLDLYNLYNFYNLGHEYYKYLNDTTITNSAGNVGYWDVNIDAYIMYPKTFKITLQPHGANALVKIYDKATQQKLREFVMNLGLNTSATRFAKEIEETCRFDNSYLQRAYKYTCKYRGGLGELGYSKFFDTDIYVSYKTKQIYTIDKVRDLELLSYAGCQYKADHLHESCSISIPLTLWCTDGMTCEERYSTFSQQVDMFEICPETYYDKDISCMFETEDELRKILNIN